MIICKSDQLDEARRLHPDEPLLCEDTGYVELPGGLVVHYSRRQVQQARDSADSSTFELEQP